MTLALTPPDWTSHARCARGRRMTTREQRRELFAWNDEIRRAREEYYAHPIITEARCEICGKLWRVRVCDKCDWKFRWAEMLRTDGAGA